MKYAYQRQGGAIYDWNGLSVPHQSRAADSVALGSLGGSTLDQPTLLLPKPGAPEPIGVTRAMGGCGCGGSCGCSGGAMGDLVDSFPGGYVGMGIAAVVAWMVFRKKRR